MCGEHHGTRKDGTKFAGSSPHVRGTHDGRPEPASTSGIIPACAGNTSCTRCTRTRIRDHPRMCGEHMTAWESGGVTQGSSPHVRGTHEPLSAHLWPLGIIPACAGNTPFGLRPQSRLGDHPRMCGEHNGKISWIYKDSGSSPHVRGTLPARNALRTTVGIIPACAGNTV